MVTGKKLIIVMAAFFMATLAVNGGNRFITRKVLFSLDQNNLRINLIFKNKSKGPYYIPVGRWDIAGKKDGNYFGVYNYNPLLVTMITYFPKFYRSPEAQFWGGHTYIRTYFPKFLELRPGNSASITVELNNFKNYINLNKSYRFIIFTPYISTKELNQLSELFKIPKEEMIASNTHISNCFVIAPPFILERHNTEIWEEEIRNIFCTSHLITENDDEKFPLFWSNIDTLRTEVILSKGSYKSRIRK